MGNKLNIYVVEDNLLIAASLEHMLVSLGHNVCGTSATYKKAVFELQNMKVDLVITDIMLDGEKNGIDLGMYIKEHLKIPFIYQSSVSSAEVIHAALKSFPSAYLFKPVSKASLAEAIMASGNSGNTVFSNVNLSTFCPRQ